MNRLVRIAVAGAVLALTFSAASADKMDCGKGYKDVFSVIAASAPAKMSGEQVAAFSRQALRAYDACMAGDEQEALAIFDRIRKSAP